MFPYFKGIKPAKTFKKVDLPAPDGPTIATVFPCDAVKVMSARALLVAE